MVSRENTVIGACIALATALFVLFQGPWIDPQDTVVVAVVVVVGVLVPLFVNHYLDSREE